MPSSTERGDTAGRCFIVAAIHSWNRVVFDDLIAPMPGAWTFVGTREDLAPESVRRDHPDYIFFLHWSWKVPVEIVSQFRCVAFHMTDLPYGRGGSPLQNLILGGHTSTKLTAFRMTGEFDAGPVYLKCDLSLHGPAQDIYERASRLAASMIERIVSENISPVPQEGPVTVFRRRRPAQSEIPESGEMSELYDFIRMLDAEGYPRAFLVRGRHRYEFSNAVLEEGLVRAEVAITPVPDHSP